MKRAAWWAAALAYAGCWLVVVAAGFGAGPPSTVALAVAASFFPYAALVVAHVGDARSARACRRALWLTLGLGLVLLAVPPVLSDDLYRYVWDGRVLAAGHDPYAHAPDAPALAGLRDAHALRVNHPELPTIYPPLAIAAFAALSGLGLLGPKLLGLLGHALLVLAVARLTPPARSAQASFAVALNPLLLAEGPLNGHIDVLAAACVLLALLAWSRLPGGTSTVGPVVTTPRPHRARADRAARFRVGLFGALAIGLKLVGFLLVPLLAGARDRRLRWVAPALLLVGVALLAPLPFAGHAERDVPSGLGQYATRWRGNDGAYGVLERGIERALVRHYGLRWGKLDLEPEPTWLRQLARLGVDPRAGLLGPKKEPPPPTLVEPSVLARPLARACVVLLLLLVVLSVVVRPVPPALALRRIVLAALLLTPQLHPWYLALLVPLELVTGRAAGLAFAAGVYVAYVPLDAWAATRTWQVDSGALVAMHLLVLGVWIAERVLARSATRGPELRER
ncbi:MAG: hypothetical protein IPG81_19430 [Sandaracinaceae bacterium]|nr:hypothetical protein [Sandaracinaceae bacterium]